MAKKLGQTTLNNVLVISTDTSPIDVSGIEAGIGSYICASDGSGMYYKYGVLDTQWVCLDKVVFGSATLDFPNLNPNSFADLTINVSGSSVGDCVSLGIPVSSLSGLVIFNSFVSSANTVTVRAYNLDGAQINPPSGLFKVIVSKSV